MPAYIGFFVEINDFAAFSEYGSAAAATYGNYGGKILFRGPVVEILEGALDLQKGARLVVLEFPSLDEAHGWWNSDDYQALIKLREPPIAQSRVFVIDGLADPTRHSGPA